MNIERYILESGDNIKEQIGTFNRWIKENDYHRQEVEQKILGLKLELTQLSLIKNEIEKYLKIAKVLYKTGE